MDTVLRRLRGNLPVGSALLAGSAMLLLAACGSSTSTATSANAVGTTGATAAQGMSGSVLIQGVVLDSGKRPVASANVECMGEVDCAAPQSQPSVQDGPDQGVKTDANGAYQIVVNARSGNTDGHFLLSANAMNLNPAFQSLKVPDSACTPDQARCDMTANFTLTDQSAP